MVDNTPLLGQDAQPSKVKTCLKGTGKVIGALLGLWVVLAVLLQAVMYKWATMQCSASMLQDYEYPGGGKKDLIEPNTILVEQDAKWWGSSFIVLPSNEDGLVKGASTGVYFKTWGPIFNTYTYQDDLGTQTFVVRDRPISIGGSHKIMRCDGTGPDYVYSEGGHFLMNRIRSMFGMYTTREYNIYEDGKLVAVSQKLGGDSQSHKQLIFRDPEKASPFASAFLQSRHFHGQYDEWFVHSMAADTTLPNFVPNGATALMAFVTSESKKSAKDAKASNDHDSYIATGNFSGFLAAEATTAPAAEQGTDADALEAGQVAADAKADAPQPEEAKAEEPKADAPQPAEAKAKFVEVAAPVASDAKAEAAEQTETAAPASEVAVNA